MSSKQSAMSHLTNLSLALLLLAWSSQGFRVRKMVDLSNRKMSSPVSTELLPREKQRSGRFLNPFSLFHLVQFPNTECVTGAGSQGTCYTSSECANRGGTADGSCAR